MHLPRSLWREAIFAHFYHPTIHDSQCGQFYFTGPYKMCPGHFATAGRAAFCDEQLFAMPPPQSDTVGPAVTRSSDYLWYMAKCCHASDLLVLQRRLAIAWSRRQPHKNVQLLLRWRQQNSTVCMAHNMLVHISPRLAIV